MRGHLLGMLETMPPSRSCVSQERLINHVTDSETSNRALMPVLYFAQNRLQIVGDRLFAFAGVLNFTGPRVIE
jgi:hypothetical protein